MKRFTDAYIEYAKEFTDCPDVFLTWGALLAISSSLSRDCHVEIGSWNIAPHIWPVLIGKSSSHKSTALSITESLIENVDIDRLAPHEFSQEALLKALSERPRRMFIFDEAKGFFDSMAKKYNEGLKSLFTTLYRKPNYTRETLKHGILSIRDAYLTIGMATTPEWLRQSITDAEDSALSGFLSRFLMVPYTGEGNPPMARPPAHNYSKFMALVEMLKPMRLIAQKFDYSHAAGVLVDRWYLDTTARENENLAILGPFYEHFKNEAIHKLAVLIAVDRGEREITEEAAQEAILALSYLEDMLPALISDLTDKRWDRERKKVADYIRKRHKCKRKDLASAVHIHGENLSRLIKGLSEDNLVLVAVDKGVTRPTTTIQWIGEDI